MYMITLGQVLVATMSMQFSCKHKETTFEDAHPPTPLFFQRLKKTPKYKDLQRITTPV